MAYTKLFSSIVTSTIWSESDRTRIVWITMMAICDKNGEVQGSIPGLARIAGVPVEDCRAAIATFLAPDPDSRTKDDEGRRIEEIDGGWVLLNYRKYREMASGEDRLRSAAERQARARERKKRNAESRTSHAPVTPKSHQICQAEAEAEAEADSIHTPDNKSHAGVSCAAPPTDPRAIQPTMEQAMAHADRLAITKDCAEKWWLETDARGWVDGRGQEIRNWQSALQAYGVSWRNTTGKMALINGKPQPKAEFQKPTVSTM